MGRALHWENQKAGILQMRRELSSDGMNLKGRFFFFFFLHGSRVDMVWREPWVSRKCQCFPGPKDFCHLGGEGGASYPERQRGPAASSREGQGLYKARRL